MEEQSFKSHAKFVPPFHFVIVPLLLFTFLGSLVNLYQSMGDHERLYSAALIATLSFGALGAALFGRVFALQAQDRVIRLEENLRHQTLTGKLLDNRLTRGQVIALRFASDAEFPALAADAAAKGTAPKDIKAAIKKWRVDNHRL
jgi:hypothetical protein